MPADLHHADATGPAARPGARGRVGRARRPRIYLDNAASTPVDPEVAARMHEVQLHQGANPASVHRDGLRAAREVELARARIAERLGCPPETLTFTGCATEANNMVLKGVVWSATARRGAPSRPPHVVVSAIEHPSILDVAAWLERSGQARVTRLPVDRQGRVSADTLAAALDDDTVLVSVMHVNNEVGTIQPLAELGAVCRDRGVLFHSDACQGFLKETLDLSTLPVDLLTINAHKVHGPKGVGALYQRPGVELTPLLHGGGHESGRRSGTLNVAGIAGFGEAVVRYTADEVDRIGALRDLLVTRLSTRIPDLRIHSPPTGAVCNIVNLAVPGHSGKKLFMALDRRGIQVSSSSACHSTKLTPSHVLLAMGLDDRQADEALRVSLGRFTRPEDLDALVDALVDILESGETLADRNPDRERP
ncbi:MAG: cysteine desulfurase [Deltaproteobacteria bacterium]|nr:MAG: cysteine desulfurase [Deltaproteobacteria bacterium]